jgi:predicted aminopeptidase
VAVIFHELAHQQLYVADDTAFNESFASFVEHEGLRQWRAARGLAARDPAGEQQREHFIALVLASRARLAQLYASELPATQMRARKAAEFDRLRTEYHALRENHWAGQGRYDNWINTPMNNAKLLPFGLYDQWVPAFAALFEQVDRDWPRFYERVAALGQLPEAQRHQALTDLLAVTQN